MKGIFGTLFGFIFVIILVLLFALVIYVMNPVGTAASFTKGVDDVRKINLIEQNNPQCLIDEWHTYCQKINATPQIKILNGFLIGEYEAKLCVGTYGEERFYYTDEVISKCLR